MSNHRQVFTKKRKIAGLILAVLGAFFFVAATHQKAHPVVISTQESSFKTIIFDLGDVLFATNQWQKQKLIASTLLYNPILCYHLINFDTKTEYFKFLYSVPTTGKEIIFYHNEPMPGIMADWQTGLQSGSEITTKITAHLETTQHPVAIKNLFAAIATFMFTPETLAASQQPIDSMIRMAQAFKSAGYALYVLSNWDENSFNIVRANHPEIFNLFDGILVSGQEKMAKPNPEFFQKLLQKYNINPETTIFIDDEPNNIETARALGITSIQCDKPASVTRELINLGVVKLQ
ncbi:HAD family phosphatase [Candidatus Babeliales bacterium]|nr:HAD family phosphatase [Candidatus Babeliales bacterium]